MSDQFVAEPRIFGCNFPPVGWAFADGQLLPISQNTALFSLLGTTYGGDGQSTFGMPDLRGRIPIGAGQGPGLSPYTLGQTGGSETVTLTTAALAAHTHSATPSLSASAPGVTTKGTTHEPSPSVALAAPVEQGANVRIYSD